MLEIDWNMKLPNQADIYKMWSEIKYKREDIVNANLISFIKLFESNFSGSINFSCYQVSESIVFDWFASRNRLHEIGFFKNFLSSSIVLKSFLSSGKEISYTDDNDFKVGNSLSLDGELAAELLYSGVYRRFSGSHAEAKQICMKFCYDLFEDRYNEINVYTSNIAWNSWFYDFIIDTTYIIIDKKYRKIYLFCLTDVD